MTGQDSLAKLIGDLRKNPQSPRKFKVILGDGYDKTPEMTDPKRIVNRDIGDPSDITPDEHAKIWKKYEYVRFKTTNQVPDALLFYIIQLTELGIVSSVVTTNYDCYWASIKERRANNGVTLSMNPLPSPPTRDGYYTRVSSRPRRNPNLAVYQIHGRLDFARYSCGHRCSLPKFMSSAHPPVRVIETRSPMCLHPWISHNHGPDSQDQYRHDIDWLNHDNRERYQPETRQAIREISDEGTTAGVFIMGFTGYYTGLPGDERRDEELVPIIEDVAKAGTIPIWSIVSSEQDRTIRRKGRDLYLSTRIGQYPSVHVFDPQDSIGEWFANYLDYHYHVIGIRMFRLGRIFERDWVGKRFLRRERFS